AGVEDGEAAADDVAAAPVAADVESRIRGPARAEPGRVTKAAGDQLLTPGRRENQVPVLAILGLQVEVDGIVRPIAGSEEAVSRRCERRRLAEPDRIARIAAEVEEGGTRRRRWEGACSCGRREHKRQRESEG